MPLHRPAGADGARRSSTPRRPPAGCASTRPSSTSTTSRRRSASPATAGCGSPLCSPAAIERIERIAASRPLDPGRRSTSASRSRTRASTRPTTRPRSPRSSSLDQQVEWMLDNGGLEWAAGRCDRVGRRSSTAGPRRTRYATPFVDRPRRAQPRRRHHRLRRRASTPPRSRRCCAPTASSTPSRTASSAATSCASRCSRRSSPTTSPRSPAAIDYVIDAL